MNTTTQTPAISEITCAWHGRHEDNVKVIGASSLEVARQHAMDFFRNEDNGCDDEGITLDEGILVTWEYDDPKPEDWQDYYVFRSVDAYPVDQREWWEK
jgi:hypothetical protein